MSEPPDDSLLSAWSSGGSEEAFTALAKRYGGLLYHAAKRQTGREDLAGEAAQNALLILARKAPRLRHLPCLSGWLHRTACYEAAKILRRERRHEARMKHLPIDDEHTPESSWRDAVPLLDQALDALPEKDRQVIFLKYFDGLTFEQMARQFGGEPAAWRQRGSRAVERLRGSLAKRGVTVGASAIATGLGTTLSQAAPASIIASMGASHAAVATLSWKTLTLHSLHLMKMKPAIVISAVLLASFVPLGLQAHAISTARERVALMETQVRTRADGGHTLPRRTASLKKSVSSKTNLIALADALMAGEQGNLLKGLMAEKKIRAMNADELEGILMESLDAEMTTAQRKVLVRSLFREFCRLAEKSKMPCDRVITLATRLARKMGTAQGSIWNAANNTIDRWMTTDLDAAVAWFGEARGSGLLDDSEGTLVLGSQVFDGLHRRNRDDAVRFYRSLPDAERRAIIGGGSGRGNPEQMMDLAMEIGDDRLRGIALAQLFSYSEGKSPQEIRSWIDRLPPSPNQAEELLANAARGQAGIIKTDEMLKRIDWLREASEGRDFSHAAGIFLAEVARINRDQIGEVVEAEWKRNPDERMLASYLGRTFFSSEALIVDAIPLSNRITDPELRDDALRRLLTWTRSDEEGRALARKGGLPEEEIDRLIPKKP